jgi:hypothetical protein
VFNEYSLNDDVQSLSRKLCCSLIDYVMRNNGRGSGRGYGAVLIALEGSASRHGCGTRTAEEIRKSQNGRLGQQSRIKLDWLPQPGWAMGSAHLPHRVDMAAAGYAQDRHQSVMRGLRGFHRRTVFESRSNKSSTRPSVWSTIASIDSGLA